MDIASHQTENNDINKEKNDLKVTVIFPAKNEEGTIENTVSMASRSSSPSRWSRRSTSVIEVLP